MTSLSLSWWSDGKETACNAGDLGSIPGLGRSLEGGNGYPLQYSGLENFTDRGAWQATYSPWGRKELDTTEQLSFSLSFIVQCVLRMFVIIYSKKYTHTQNEGNTVNFTMS